MKSVILMLLILTTEVLNAVAHLYDLQPKDKNKDDNEKTTDILRRVIMKN